EDVSTYICDHFHQTTTRMIRKFAMLATTAALFVACGSNVEENAGTMDAAQETTTEAMDQIQEEVQEAADAIDSTSGAAMDSVEEAVGEAKEAVEKAAQ